MEDRTTITFKDATETVDLTSVKLQSATSSEGPFNTITPTAASGLNVIILPSDVSYLKGTVTTNKATYSFAI